MTGLDKNIKIKSIVQIIVSIILSELFIMYLLSILQIENKFLEGLLDSSLLAILVLPFVYIILVKKIIEKNERSIFQITKRQEYLDLVTLVSETDINGIITNVNKNFCRVHQYSKEELIGQNYKLISSKKHPKEFWKKIWKELKDEKIWQGVICNRSKDGKYHWHETAIVPKYNTKNDLSGYIGIKIDVTSSKFLTDKLNQSSKLASLGLLAAGVGHEINNPLTIVKNYALKSIKELEKDVIDKDKLKKYLDKQVSASKRIESIVKGLKIHARTSVDSKLEKLDIHNIISSTLPMVESMLKDEGISISLDLLATDLFVIAPEGKFEQVFINLLTNAKDAVSNSKEKTIKISTFNKSGNIIIKVTDSGMGIAEDIQQKIFETFFTTKVVGKGTGMGLGISSTIIENMNGSLTVQSTEGHGATFSITLPTS